jgi:hypothetical protein
MRRGLAIAGAAVMAIGLLGCGGTVETPFQEAGKEAREAHHRFKTALKHFEEGSTQVNREIRREYYSTGGPERTCAHLRAHQLHSPNRILAQEAREFIEEECG